MNFLRASVFRPFPAWRAGYSAGRAGPWLAKPARPVPPPREDMSHVARPVWPVATRKSKLTARRLVITFVPTASWETDELGNWSAEKGIEAIKTHAPHAKVEDHSET